MSNANKIQITKIDNAYVVGCPDRWGDVSKEVALDDFEAVLGYLAEKFGEEELAATFVESRNMVRSLANICTTVLEPKLAAIEAKVNPGIENVVDSDDEGF